MDSKMKWSIWAAASMAVFLQQLIYLMLHRTTLQFAMDVALVLPLFVIGAGASRIAFICGRESNLPERLEAEAALVQAIEKDAYGSHWKSRASNPISDSVPLEGGRADEVSIFDTALASRAHLATGTTIEGRLGQLVVAVQERFWNTGREFDPRDRGSFSSQDTIIEWIKEQQPGISNAKAKAVELVACPIER